MILLSQLPLRSLYISSQVFIRSFESDSELASLEHEDEILLQANIFPSREVLGEMGSAIITPMGSLFYL